MKETDYRLLDATCLPEADEVDPFIDTKSIQLDRVLGIVHANEAYFATVREGAYTYMAEAPIEEAAEHGREYTHTIKRANQNVYKRVALSLFEDLRNHSPLGGAIAQDVLESWRQPVEVTLVEGQTQEVRR